MVALSEQKRAEYAVYQPAFWHAALPKPWLSAVISTNPSAPC
jgi:hypothetical protein